MMENQLYGSTIVHPNPFVLDLNRLQNLLREKDRELGVAQGEIKALRAIEALKEKAVDELRTEVQKTEEKLQVTENLLEHKVSPGFTEVSWSPTSQEEKRTLERELARVKVLARLRKWIEERRLMQAEMQRLRDKLATSKRTAKAEA